MLNSNDAADDLSSSFWHFMRPINIRTSFTPLSLTWISNHSYSLKLKNERSFSLAFEWKLEMRWSKMAIFSPPHLPPPSHLQAYTCFTSSFLFLSLSFSFTIKTTPMHMYSVTTRINAHIKPQCVKIVWIHAHTYSRACGSKRWWLCS